MDEMMLDTKQYIIIKFDSEQYGISIQHSQTSADNKGSSHSALLPRHNQLKR